MEGPHHVDLASLCFSTTHHISQGMKSHFAISQTVHQFCREPFLNLYFLKESGVSSVIVTLRPSLHDSLHDCLHDCLHKFSSFD